MSSAAAPWRIDPRHDVPLRILIGPDDAARAASRRWLDAVDLDHLDAETGHLLPPMQLRLHALGIEHAAMSRLRGVHRYHWYRNQVQLRALQPVLRAAGERNIPIAPIGALAVMLRYCNTLGARELAPIELLLPGDMLPMAVTILEEAGWQRGADAPTRITRAYTATRSSMPFASRDGYVLVLHWRLFDWGLRPRAPIDLIHTDHRIVVDGIALRAIDAAELLLSICVLDPTRPPTSPLWLVNAAAIARAEAMNWQHFVHRAGEAGVSRNAARTMQLLERFGQPIPANVLATLRATGRDADRLVAGLHRIEAGVAPIAYRCARLLARCRDAESPDGVLGYFRDLWDLERRRDVIREVSRRALNGTTARRP